MKRFSKNSVQPINISLISALQKDNIQAIHSSKSDERQNTCELQAVQSHSRIINVAPIHLEEEIIESLDNINTIQPMNLPIEEEEQGEFELQSHSRIINIAQIHLEEESVESLENINIIQLLNMPMPIENNNPNSIDVENPESEETPEMPDQVVLCLNNRKFNPNMISSTGLTFLFVIIFIVGPFFIWNLSFSDDYESWVFKSHIYYCLPVALPIGYFIVNPKHLIPALKIVFDI